MRFKVTGGGRSSLTFKQLAIGDFFCLKREHQHFLVRASTNNPDTIHYVYLKTREIHTVDYLSGDKDNSRVNTLGMGACNQFRIKPEDEVVKLDAELAINLGN